MSQKTRSVLCIVLCFLATSVFAATGTLFPSPWFTALDTNGNPISSAKACFYTAGTSTLATTYSDVSLTTPNANPVRADISGRVGPVYLTPGQSYKLILQDSTGTAGTCDGAVVRTQDNIAAVPTSAASVDVNGTAGEAITAGQAVYLSDGSGGKVSGQWYKADSANTYSATTNWVGMATVNISSGATGAIRLSGQVTGLSSLSVGSTYYVGTAGAITTTAPTNARRIGQADSATSLLVNGNPWLWSSLTPNALVLATGAATLGTTAALTNGQLPIGNTGNAPTLATLTAGEGVQVTNGGGSIAIANGVLDHKTSATTINNSAAETTLYSFAVPGGTLSTNRLLHWSGVGSIIQNSGVSDKTYTIKVKYGARTVSNIALSNVPAANASGPLTIDCEIMAAGATNAQVTKCLLTLGYSAADFNVSGLSQGNLAATWYAELITINSADVSGNVDSTASQNLVVTGQMSAAAATMTLSLNTAYTEVK